VKKYEYEALQIKNVSSKDIRRIKSQRKTFWSSGISSILLINASERDAAAWKKLFNESDPLKCLEMP